MKLKNFISSALVTGMLLNSGITSFAGILSEDGRYETFEGNDITITDVLEEDKSDIEIEGNTLINLAKVTTPINFGVNSQERVYTIPCLRPVEPGKIYTLFARCTEYNLNAVNGVRFGNWNLSNGTVSDVSICKEKGGIVHKFKVNENATYKRVQIYIDNDNTEGNAVLTDFVLLEGDYTNTPIEYFEGMKSAGELENNKLNLKISNKNLLDFKEDEVYGNNYDFESKRLQFSVNQDKSITFNGSSTFDTTDLYLLGGWDKTKPIMRLKKGTYTLSLGDNIKHGDFRLYLLNGTSVVMHAYNINTITLNEDKDITGVMIRCSNGVTYDNVTVYPQLELSSKKTEYNKYIEDVKAINLKEPLRGLPKGAKDRIIKRNGQWVIERNCGLAILDGTEDWFIETTDSGIKFFSEHTGLNNKHYHKISSTAVLSDKLINNKMYLNMPESDFLDYGITTDLLGSHEWRISTTQDMTVDELKEWLSINRPNVVYELEEPVYEPLNIDTSINLYLDTTYISNNSTIPAGIKVTVDRVLNRATEAIETAKTSPTIENISIARMWTNLAKETIKKDELQNEINDITDIEDLKLDKKTATANLDLYIKSANSLTMSLSTNSIVFEDYSGVEDLERLNAVEITVNSSLPYSLNAYMPASISNVDGSKVMDANTLNIRDNTESNYSQFRNTTDKIILKDDCDAGNNNIHKIDIKLGSNNLHKADVYKTVVKFEAEQK